ncbi:thioesterase II family protein [Streptomyces profundus]|uniref:thioesterase II family protein n=1 Tax=Streptomyces profundus TaxID=2867410 RepID=UPI001D164DE0|nr:alpha/beta fold hydrolase [Streptomyces sp. MA3_2.13]UED87258.1 alpha/beta fold hydrolase [Streptomyces sp. MA3_2.13]
MAERGSGPTAGPGGRANGNTDWVRRYHPNPHAPFRLVALPHAGGSASYFFRFAELMAPTAEVLAVQYPGRQDRIADPPLPSVELLADAAHLALRPFADRPLAFFGHSMGAVLAYEVARRFEATDGLVAQGLFLSGRRAPTVHRTETVHQRDDDGLIAEVVSLSGTDAAVLRDPSIVAMVLPALRGDYTAIETHRHRPGPPLRAPLHVLLGDVDPRVDEEEGRAWAPLSEGPFSLDTFPGAHFYLADHWEAVARRVAAALASSPLPDSAAR